MDIRITKNSPLFCGLDEADFKQAMQLLQAKKREYARGEYLKPAGAALPCFGLVLKGTVQVFMDDISGHSMIMANVGAGETFGESLSYLAIADGPMYILAASECSVLWLNPACIRNPAAQPQESARLTALLQNRFTALLAERALQMNQRIQILSKGSIRAKLVTFFAQQMARAGSSSFTVPFDRSSMATYIGADRSSLSRELAKMRDEKLLRFHKNDFEILKDFAD